MGEMTGTKKGGPEVRGVGLANVEWGSAGAACSGGESGDVCVVAFFPDGVLVATIDGLGHGVEAALAAKAAAQVLETYAGEPVLTLVRRCHDSIRGTRGVVMSLASLDTRDASITWTGVGNVEGVLLRAGAVAGGRDEAIPLRGGVVGYQLPPLKAGTAHVSVGDILIMATDGIRSGFTAGVNRRGRTQEIAESILETHARGSDDALVVVVRYLGAPA
jgi:phosphoserine phosphatase RsbX